MKFVGTYHKLISIRQDCIEILTNSPALGLFLDQKIKNFYGFNNLQLQIADDKMKRLKEQYVEKDEKGNFLILEKDSDQGVKFKFKSEEAAVAFHKEYNEFMARTITIES